MSAVAEFFRDLWHLLAGGLTLLLSVIASAHVVLHKRDSRAAVGWAGLIWLAPIVGPALYILFGINRIRRKATALRALPPAIRTGEYHTPAELTGAGALAREAGHLAALVRVVDQVSARPLTAGNAVTPLLNGDEAYPVMLDAIAGATRTVALSTYIFDHDAAGRQFTAALEEAVARGVRVRVLIDAVGARYSWPSSVRILARRGVPVARFGRTTLPWRMPYMNLRNHRKLLIVDGQVAFTGGMNIREGNLVARSPRAPIQDVHFRLEGPVVGHLMQTFAEDWLFATREVLSEGDWSSGATAVGSTYARGINDGPDADFERARFTFLGALACARERVRIVTPYFLPDQSLITGLDVAALRGVSVEILLPARSNLALVQWASTAQLWQVLRRGCRVFFTPPPFDHSKLMVVDDIWTLIGSSNWDARSLRLNFEFDVECYDTELAHRINGIIEAKRSRARRIRLEDVDARPLSVKLRDGVARLAAPYL